MLGLSERLGLDVSVPSWDLQCKVVMERRWRQEILHQGIARQGKKCQLDQHFFFLNQTQYHGKQEVTSGLTTCDKQDQLCNVSLSVDN